VEGDYSESQVPRGYETSTILSTGDSEMTKRNNLTGERIMPTEGQYLRGTDAPASERIELRAGPLEMCFEPGIGFLRYIRLGDQEILRGLYSAVRDHNWNTIAPEVTNLSVSEGEDGFEVTFDVAHVERDIDFRWRGSILGTAEGTVTFSMEGQAHSTFKRNRVGFCVLHSPTHVAGTRCSVEKADGFVEEGRFPDTISPDQPFKDMRAIRHEVLPGVIAEVRFAGDVFEMEDQRNWTDASYKTYCTPLGQPYPVEVEEGTHISQAVTVSVSGALESHVGEADRSEIILNVDAASIAPLPEIGLGLANPPADLTEAQIQELQAMHLSHLRVDLRLAEPAWESVLEKAAGQAQSVGARLEAGLHVSDAASAELQSLAGVLAARGDDIVSRFLLYHVAEAVADRKWVEAARSALAGLDAPIVSGANAYFTELNRNRPPVEVLDGVCYSLNPQVHAFDDASLMETPIAQGWTVESARRFSGPLPVHVSPVTLSPRFNPNATGPDSVSESDVLPSGVDARQMSLFGAAWTVGSLKYLAESRAASVTYFETVGWKGVLDSEAGSPAPFPSIAGGAFPMAQVFTLFGGMAGGDVLTSHSSQHRKVDSVVLQRDGWVRLLVANMTAAPQVARVNCARLSGTVRVETLDLETAELAVENPRGFRSRKDIRNTETVGGSFVVELGPHAVLCVKGQLSD
jgi:hypothetical protein